MKYPAGFSAQEKIPDMAAFERLVPELERAFELARYERMPYVEMMPKGMSKADGIRILLEELDIPLSNTYAFGDTTWKCYNMYSTERRWAMRKRASFGLRNTEQKECGRMAWPALWKGTD